MGLRAKRASRTGDQAAAMELLEAALAIYVEHGDVRRASRTYADIVDVATRDGDLERAESAHRDAGRLTSGGPWRQADLDARLGLARVIGGRYDDAAPLLVSALEQFHHGRTHAECRWVLEALTLCEFGAGRHGSAIELLGATEGLGDARVRPGNVIGYSDSFEDLTAECARSLGPDGYHAALERGRARELDELIGDLAACSEAASVPSSVALSERELEVAALVAEGLSNRVIAERLFITPRTVRGHVENILAKLGFESRVQIATWYDPSSPGDSVSDR